MKERIESTTHSGMVLEQKHKEQMEEAMENMDALRATHKKETAQIQENMKQQSKPNPLCVWEGCEYFLTVQKDIELLERTIQDKNGEIRQLQKENAELERAKHTEVVKLRLEVCIPMFAWYNTVHGTHTFSMMLKC